MVRFSTNIKISKEDKNYIKKCLPENWETEVKEVFVEKDFEIFIRINATNVDEVQQWIQEYQKITESSYSVETTYKCQGQRVNFKRTYHCQHRTRHKHTYDPIYHKSIKNTNCPSTLSVTIRAIKSRYQGKDKSKAPDQNKPCEIRIKLKHNHSTNNSMALKFKKVLPDVKQELINLFQQGHTAATALQTLKVNLRLNHANFKEILLDRSRCPDYSYCHYLYQKTIGNESANDKNDLLKKKLEEYNIKMGSESASIVLTDSGFVICLCPPFVQRCHQFEENSSKIVFIDSFSTFDKNNGRISILLSQSESGGVPLGVVIKNSNNYYDITIGFNLLKEMLGEKAFFGSSDGPQVFLSDEFLIDNKMLTSIWPKSKNLYSSFHILHNIWKWLQSSANGIPNEDKQSLFKDFYYTLYAETEEDFQSKYEIAIQNSSKYKNYVYHLKSYYDKRELWAICYRPKFIETYSEIVMRTLRDKIFQKLKSFNLIQMVDFITNNFFKYFENQYLGLANNSDITNLFFEPNPIPNEKILKNIQIINKNMRLVPSETAKDLFYIVNTNLLICTCFDGSSNIICKHIQWVTSLINMEDKSKYNIDIRKKCYFIATGEELEVNNIEENITTDENKSSFEENFITMDTTEFSDINEYLLIKRKDDSMIECREYMEKIQNKFEELLEKDPKSLLPVLNILYSRFNTVNTLSEICSVFSIDEKV